MLLVDNVRYKQGICYQLLFQMTPSALHYCGQEHAASHFSTTTTTPTVQDLPGPKAIQILMAKMIKHIPEITGVVAFNQNQKRKNNCVSIDD
jgi:hypothetical protein